VLRRLGHAVLAAISWNLDVLRRDILPGRWRRGGPEHRGRVDGDERPVYSGSLAGADRVVTVSVGDELPAWRVPSTSRRGCRPGGGASADHALHRRLGLLLVVIRGSWPRIAS